MENKEFVCASFFAGVGGIELGFKNAGFKTIYANEFNKFAIETYEANNDIKVDDRDIYEVPANEIPDFNIMLAGFPCQPFSVAGNRQGFDDEKGRGHLFFELMRIVKEKKPEVIFLENVRGLVNHDDGHTFAVIKRNLMEEGYYIKWKIMNTKYFGNLPQNRERIYILAFKDKMLCDNFYFPKMIKRFKTVHSVIDFNKKVNDKYYYTDDNFKYYDILSENVRSNKTVYQWRRKYARENKSNLCPTLTNNMGTGGHNVPIVLAKHGIRRITPRECFNLQGFPKEFVFPKYMSDMHLYAQAGNSVSVPVIERIAKQLKIAIEKTYEKKSEE